MSCAQAHAIQDVCILVTDIEASIRFYTEKLGFNLKHRAPGFADFTGADRTLALWERDYIAHHADVRVRPGSTSAVLIAVLVDSPTVLNDIHDDLLAKGVIFLNPPRTYAWNAHCAYFHGPDGEAWELYAWLGTPGKVDPS
jgi:uncharacterized protein